MKKARKDLGWSCGGVPVISPRSGECTERNHEGYLCVYERGHRSPHVALTTDGRLCAVWPREESKEN